MSKADVIEISGMGDFAGRRRTDTRTGRGAAADEKRG